MEEYKIQLPEAIAKVNNCITTLLHAPVVLDIGQCVQANNKPSSQTLLREMNKPFSSQSVRESIGTQAASTVLRESSNCSFWRSSTKPAHCASGCQQQLSGLIKVLNHSAIHSTITTKEDSTPFLGDPLGTRYHHLGTMTQNDKARECEMMYILILALPKSTCAKGRSRPFHLDQETTADTLTGWYCQNLLFAREDIEKYKIQIPTSMMLLQNASSYIANPYVNSNP